jgi:hypothetical protein
MAALPEIRSGTTTVRNITLDGVTLPLPDQPSDVEETTPPVERRTVSRIERTEKGDVKKKDIHAADKDLEAAQRAAEIAAQRRKVAAEAVSRAITRLSSHCGQARAAADLQLLKRELSRCHDILGTFPSESDFLSIVVLVEAELGKKPWSALTRDELQFLKRAVDVGAHQDRVTFDDYMRHLRTLNASGFSTGPVIEFGEEEEEAPDE